MINASLLVQRVALVIALLVSSIVVLVVRRGNLSELAYRLLHLKQRAVLSLPHSPLVPQVPKPTFLSRLVLPCPKPGKLHHYRCCERA